MPNQAVQPLRIQKSTPTSSPNKSNGASQRPLSEIRPMERRRNSPSSFQQPKKGQHIEPESSPFDPTPISPYKTEASTRLFWQGRDPATPSRLSNGNRTYDLGGSASPKKRSSIENLKRASRVKNSTMFAREQQREYDPTSTPQIERPLAAGRPLSLNNSFNSQGTPEPQLAPLQSPLKIVSKIPQLSPTKTPSKTPNGSTRPDPTRSSPTKDASSPTKSSLSSPSKYALNAKRFDPDSGTWSDDEPGEERVLPPGRVLHRHAKSVTFDAAPPQINEYERTTPDVSSVGSPTREGSYDSAEDENSSYNRSQSVDIEDSFDASLEDINKTPVVGPEDWRFMSPSAASNILTSRMDDPFSPDRGSATPEGDSSISTLRRPVSRTGSNTSDGGRPLPPLPPTSQPGAQTSPPERPSSASGLLNNVQRTLPSPPAPSPISKLEMRSLGGMKMPLDEKLRLMMNPNEENDISSTESQPDKQQRQSDGDWRRDSGSQSQREISIYEDEADHEGQPDLPQYRLPPRISRESILQKVKGQDQRSEALDLNLSSPMPSSSPERSMLIDLDPDQPLPSTEVEEPSILEQRNLSAIIKEELLDEEDEFDVYSIPDLYGGQPSEPLPVEIDPPAVHQPVRDDDDESAYSCDTTGEDRQESPSVNDDGVVTPRQHSPAREASPVSNHRMSLPEFASLLGDKDLDLALGSYMSSSSSPRPTAASAAGLAAEPSVANHLDYRPMTPDDEFRMPKFSEGDDRSSTPDSVIRHRQSYDGMDYEMEAPEIPEPVATVKAPGSRLKTRPSVTPADMAAMAAARRQVSGEISGPPAVPPIADRYLGRPSEVAEENDGFETDTETETVDGEEPIGGTLDRALSVRESMIKLNIGDSEEDLSFRLDKEFDRLLEDKKRGYLMRQNTKVIVATSNSEGAPGLVNPRDKAVKAPRTSDNSPRKASTESKTWSVEPWNGKMRQRSLKEPALSPRKKIPNAPVPPLPGQASNVSGAADAAPEIDAAVEERQEGVERGRLFVKVVGVKDLDLPLPKGEKSWFNLTLDNGIHCVQTAWLELNRSAPIGQEFELVVQDDLEFTLTLQTEELKPPVEPDFGASQNGVKPKQSAFSRVFTSPKKRKELEKKQQEEALRLARQKHEAETKRLSRPPTAYDLLNGLIAPDGNFGRSFFTLQEHEARAYGRPYTVDIPCFNEWATDDPKAGSSVRSKHGGVQRRAPYQIGSLELQLLFVPRPKGAKDTDMPKSLNACIREMNEAEGSKVTKWEGHLSQQGGDCPYWRRRFFKLDGSKLTAYHESTRQPRASINLAKASKLVDDRSSLMQNSSSPSKSKGRRKSAFAEEEEGYMFVEEGFRIRFANGEVIDFYADSAADKEGWMKVLADTVGKDSGAKPWTKVVLAREAALAAKHAQVDVVAARLGPVKEESRSPARYSQGAQLPVAPAKAASPRRSDGRPLPDQPLAAGTRKSNTRSMLF